MDGMHDLGGREGFGPIDVAESEEPFHAPWEARAHAISRSMGRGEDWSIDWFRHCRELIGPVDYLTRGYYDQWLQTYCAMMVNSGMATVSELASGVSKKALEGFPPPLAPAAVPNRITTIVNFQREATVEPKFGVGATVRTLTHGHSGHTRLPAYVRGRAGVIESYHGCHILPDANAHGTTKAEPLYTVRFDHAELWPEEPKTKGFVALDLWESYLEPR